jgi:hypothetical protein
MPLLEDGEWISDYLERKPLTVGAMPFLILRNCSPQIPRNEKVHRLRRLKLRDFSARLG